VAKTMFQDLTWNELYEHKKINETVLIDVRSPSEYKEFTIPGSINIPFFTDEERAEVGTIYKQVSVQAAKNRGLEIISAKLPDFIRTFSEIEGKKVVFCWRGGMRSRTTATVLDLMGIRMYRLKGGIREYRRWIVDTIEQINFKPNIYVLNGFTGSGKTVILEYLKREGYPVIDLEGLASHRGSIFGQIGLEPNNQKTFEAKLMKEVHHYQNSPYVLVEGESKRIGKVAIPDFLMDKKDKGIQLFIKMPIEERVRHILDDYQPWNHVDECITAFRKIKKRIHSPIANQIETDLQTGAFESAVTLLLEYYYDPRYKHTAEQYDNSQCFTLEVKNVEEAVSAVKELLEKNNVNAPQHF
jgi:tRNA 2-selenouridine synthase